MMSRNLRAISLFLLTFIGLSIGYSSHAQNTINDARIMTIDFVDGAVYRIEGCTNFQTLMSFSSSERIENVAVGDSNQWQVTPNKKADLLFIKSIAFNAHSNMTVITNKRRYIFELLSAPKSRCQSGKVAYEIRFNYQERVETPQDDKPKEGEPFSDMIKNNLYTYHGDKNLVPLRMFDDGLMTYVKWPEHVHTPAVFVLLPDGSESLVNYANREGFMVISEVASIWVMRLGPQTVMLYNDAYHPKGLDDLSPKPRQTKIKPVKKNNSIFKTAQKSDSEEVSSEPSQ